MQNNWISTIPENEATGETAEFFAILGRRFAMV